MVGMVTMLWVGLAATAFWLTSLKRRYSANVSPLWLLGMISSMASVVPLLFIAQNPTFYAVPIAGGFCFLMLALVSLNRALADESFSRQAFWPGVISLAWGLASGARPICDLSPPFLFWGLRFVVVVASRPRHRCRWSSVRLLAALAPTTLIGLALLTYNYLRFDDPMDFGIRFSLASADIREARLVEPEHECLIRIRKKVPPACSRTRCTARIRNPARDGAHACIPWRPKCGYCSKGIGLKELQRTLLGIIT